MDGAAPTECSVFEALFSRRSIRAFLPIPVPRDKVEAILAAASQAPSGSNIQPWNVHVLTGQVRDRFCRRLLDAHMADEPGHGDEYQYYPAEWFDPFLTRRRKLGIDLYRSLEIGRDDRDRMKAQLGRNYLFFDAPTGLIFTLDRRHGQSAWIDLGAFLQSIMLAARGHGLHTCPQQAFSRFHTLIRQQLDIPDTELVVCGMALGHPDMEAAENNLSVDRIPVAEFTRFHGDE